MSEIKGISKRSEINVGDLGASKDSSIRPAEGSIVLGPTPVHNLEPPDEESEQPDEDEDDYEEDFD